MVYLIKESMHMKDMYSEVATVIFLHNSYFAAFCFLLEQT